MAAYDYQRVWQLRYQAPVLRHRAEGAAMKLAQDILREDPQTADHAAKVAWALAAQRAPNAAVEQMITSLILNASIFAAGEAATDDDVEFVLSSEINARAAAGIL